MMDSNADFPQWLKKFLVKSLLMATLSWSETLAKRNKFLGAVKNEILSNQELGKE